MIAPAAPNKTSILSFFGFSFGWTWGLWWISSAVMPQSAGLGAALFLASAFGPSLAAFVMVFVFEGTAGFGRWMRRSLRWRLDWRWYALALFAPAGLFLAALGLHAGLGGTIPTSAAQGQYLRALWLFVPITLLGGPLGEEFGWRGYALPALTARVGWRWAAIGIGVVWGLWHLPLFWIPGTAQAGLPMGLFLASSVALSVVFSRLFVNTRFSVLPAILLHGAINWTSMVLPVMPNGGDTRPYTIVMSLLLLVAVVVMLKPGPMNP
jgi:hypothetical protein